MSQRLGGEPYQTYYQESTRRNRRNLMVSSMVAIVLFALDLKIESVGSLFGWKIVIPPENIWIALGMLGAVIVYELIIFVWSFWNEYMAWNSDNNYYYVRTGGIQIDNLVSAMQDIAMLKTPQKTIDDVNKELMRKVLVGGKENEHEVPVVRLAYDEASAVLKNLEMGHKTLKSSVQRQFFWVELVLPIGLAETGLLCLIKLI